jgi:hypothetical protein
MRNSDKVHHVNHVDDDDDDEFRDEFFYRRHSAAAKLRPRSGRIYEPRKPTAAARVVVPSRSFSGSGSRSDSEAETVGVAAAGDPLSSSSTATSSSSTDGSPASRSHVIPVTDCDEKCSKDITATTTRVRFQG